jgi:hypothetical protein
MIILFADSWTRLQLYALRLNLYASFQNSTNKDAVVRASTVHRPQMEGSIKPGFAAGRRARRHSIP